MSTSAVDLLYNGCITVQKVADELLYLSKAHTALGNEKQAEDLYEMASTLMSAKANIKKAFSSELSRSVEAAKQHRNLIASYLK